MSGRSYTIFAAVMFIAAAVIIGGGIYLLVTADRPAAEQRAALPTVITVPTRTPTRTATPLPPTRITPPTLPPTFTPTFTDTVTPSITPTSTFTPSITPTITETSSVTFTPAQTDTDTPTATPTATNTSSLPTPTRTATRSPFPFDLRGGEVIFTQNTYNAAGCAYQGIGGQVLDAQGVGINDGVRVVVIVENQRPRGALAGDNSVYGSRGGYEIGLGTRPTGATYFVELRTEETDTPISPLIALTFPSDCTQNVALLTWIQTRPF